jgi:hypothetical protein
MKKLLQFLTVAALAFAVATPTMAADKDKKKRDPNAPRTVSGEAVCPKCTLNDEGVECGQAIRTTRKDKAGKEVTRIFYVVGDLAKENHGIFCKGNKKATVTGTMKREGKGKDAKIIVTATKVSEGIVKGKGKGKGKKKKDA